MNFATESYTREKLRRTYIDAWRKQEAGMVLSPLELMIVEVIEIHPEYQPVMREFVTASTVDFRAPLEQQNLFLHMGLHIAVREQVAIDRPPGVRNLLRDISVRLIDAHRAEHGLMEALGETLWEAQKAGRAPDEVEYLRLARRRAFGGAST